MAFKLPWILKYKTQNVFQGSLSPGKEEKEKKTMKDEKPNTRFANKYLLAASVCFIFSFIYTGDYPVPFLLRVQQLYNKKGKGQDGR